MRPRGEPRASGGWGGCILSALKEPLSPGEGSACVVGAGVGPVGSCLRTSCKCYRFLPINADLIKWSPDAGPEQCVPAFSCLFLCKIPHPQDFSSIPGRETLLKIWGPST